MPSRTAEMQRCAVSARARAADAARVESARAAVKKLLREGADGIVLDLRDNGGGLLNEAVLISSIFIPEGKIVSTKGRSRPERTTGPPGGLASTLCSSDGSDTARPEKHPPRPRLLGIMIENPFYPEKLTKRGTCGLQARWSRPQTARTSKGGASSGSRKKVLRHWSTVSMTVCTPAHKRSPSVSAKNRT